MDELLAAVAAAADSAGAHATAPALLLQAQAALGQLASVTDEATDGGRKPFRTPADWPDRLAELAYVIYLLADQTAVDIDASVRALAGRVVGDATAAQTHIDTQRGDDSWF